jgi:DNA polymerase III subunit gamma/tau
MTYTVLARRYRSQSFDQVVGQEPIARTLRNAIDTNRVAHAYLFTGTRGVGKTSTARLFANALNNPKNDPKIAEAIMQGRDTDTIELDAASHTGVDNAREMIANATYKPLRGHYKIYIIDEVHMLSTSAFNALLKTMEEPPEHVKFILCTTDAHKVPATIQSRCQRFDFRNIPSNQIAQHLTAVVKQEGASADAEVLHMVARLGNGSMRDALSLLDRLMAVGEKKLTTKLLEDLLGLPDRELIGMFVDAVADGDAGAALLKADELLRRSTSIDQALEAFLLRFRDLMVMAACGANTPLVEIAEASRASEAFRSAKFDAAGLTHMIALTENVQRSCKNSACPRPLFDALVVRLALTEKLADVTAVITGRGAISSRTAPPAPALAGGSAPAKKH